MDHRRIHHLKILRQPRTYARNGVLASTATDDTHGSVCQKSLIRPGMRAGWLSRPRASGTQRSPRSVAVNPCPRGTFGPIRSRLAAVGLPDGLFAADSGASLPSDRDATAWVTALMTRRSRCAVQSNDVHTAIALQGGGCAGYRVRSPEVSPRDATPIQAARVTHAGRSRYVGRA